MAWGVKEKTHSADVLTEASRACLPHKAAHPARSSQ